MKKFIALFIFFTTINSFAQAQATDYKKIITEYTQQVDLLIAGKEYDLQKMAALAEQVWCSCTIEQLKKAGDTMSHESESTRQRSCDSSELPKTKVISDELLNKFIAQIERMKKHFGMK
jgi:hypothetical protein